jgi:hypothetical protein
MEKRKPHYDLSTVQSAIRLRGADAFTLRQDGSIVIQFKEK